MPALNAKAPTLVSTITLIDMKTAASTALYTVPAGKVFRPLFIVVRDCTASLAGGSSYTVTGLATAFSLVNLITANTGYMTVFAGSTVQSTEQAAAAVINFTVTTGATAAGTGTVDLFGYLL